MDLLDLFLIECIGFDIDISVCNFYFLCYCKIKELIIFFLFVNFLI